MLPSWYNIVYNTFGLTPWVTIPVILMAFIATVCLFIYSIILFLDASYRPEIKQYPYNFVFDGIIPIISILSPTIIILKLNPTDTSWLEKFGYIILIHIVVLIPLIDYWSKQRNWSITSNKGKYITWNQPILYKHIAIGLVYPALWGFYFSIIRYFRLGKTISLFNLADVIPLDILIIILFLLPSVLTWFFIIIQYINKMRYLYWNEFTNLTLGIHLYLLKFYPYFWILEKGHRLAFIWGTFVSLNNDVYPSHRKYSYFRYILRYFYVKPYILNFAFISIILGEIIITKGYLFLSSYFLFLYPFLYAIIFTMYYLYTMNWVYDVCNADYFAKNWENPKYPKNFWILFAEDTHRYNFSWSFSAEEIKHFEILAEQNVKENSKVFFTLPQRIKNRNYCFRLKGTYRTNNSIRWVHTEIEKPIHSLTGYFLRKFTERIALIQANWRPHYSAILRAEKMPQYSTIDTPPNCYINFPAPIPQNDMAAVLEQNFPTNFLPLIEKGVLVEQFSRNNAKHITKLDSKQQSEPDAVIDMSQQTEFLDSRLHGIDQKSGKTELGASTVFSKMTKKIYTEKLRNFKAQLDYYNPDWHASKKDELAIVYQKLIESCEDIKIHQLVWAANLHRFPNTHIPPMKVPNHFSLENVRPEFLKFLSEAKIKAYKVSNYLYAKKIPESTSGNSLPRQALELFEDSELQRILGQ